MAIDCTKQGSNLGQACVPSMLVLNNYIIVPTFDGAGVANEVDLTVDLDAAYFAAKVNHADPTKRWYPVAEMKNITDERGESLFESFADGSKEWINQGTRSFAGLIVARQYVSPQYLGKLQSFRGVQFSVFGIDKSKALIGKIGSTATKMAPIEIESGSFDAKLVKTVDGAVQKIMVNWDYDQLEEDSQLRVVQASEMTYDVSKLKGLIDVTGVVSSITVDGFTLTLKTDAGTIINPVMAEGLVTADFVSSDDDATSKVYNVTDDANVTVTVTEGVAGVYAVAFSVAQGAGDVIRVKIIKAGFDFTQVETLVITVPV